MNVLLVEDDNDIGAGLESSLKSSEFSVDWAKDGESAQAFLVSHSYDCILLDIGLPGKSGLDWLREWRGQDLREPISG